jgi:hypothetical protein
MTVAGDDSAMAAFSGVKGFSYRVEQLYHLWLLVSRRLFLIKTAVLR